MPAKIIAKGSFNIDVYNTKVHVIITADAILASKKVLELAKKHNSDVGYVPSQVYGYTVCFTKHCNEYFLIYAGDDISLNTVTHETYHLTEFIEQFKSLAQDENKEASANLNGFINQKVYQIFKKAGIVIN